MNIYTLVMTKESFSDPLVMEVVGSFSTGVKAKKAMMDQIIYMAQNDSLFAETLWKDENHFEFRARVVIDKAVDLFCRDEAKAKLPNEVLAAMWNYLAGEIGSEEGAYYVYSDEAAVREATYRFEVKKNELDPEE